MLIELAIAALNARLCSTLGESETSLGARAEPRPAGSFVGRDRELAELRAGLTDLTTGHGHLFLLSGEPGIGKTRLADEFGRLAVAQGVRVAWGSALGGRRCARILAMDPGHSRLSDRHRR